jgi:predicted amidohydrolase
MAVGPWGEVIDEAGDEPTTIIAELGDDDVSRARAVNPSLANRRIRT